MRVKKSETVDTTMKPCSVLNIFQTERSFINYVLSVLSSKKTPRVLVRFSDNENVIKIKIMLNVRNGRVL